MDCQEFFLCDESRRWSVLFMYIACHHSKLCLLDNSTEAGNTTSVGLKLMCPVSNHFDVPKCGQSWIIFFFYGTSNYNKTSPSHAKIWHPQTCTMAERIAHSHQVLIMLWQGRWMVRQTNGRFTSLIIFHLTYWLLLMKKLNMIIWGHIFA